MVVFMYVRNHILICRMVLPRFFSSGEELFTLCPFVFLEQHCTYTLSDGKHSDNNKGVTLEDQMEGKKGRRGNRDKEPTRNKTTSSPTIVVCPDGGSRTT